MSPLGILILCFSVLSCAAHVNRIVGGVPTTVEKYPVIVQVEFLVDFNLFSQLCAGSVLTRRTIVSAAHCFEVGPASTQRYRIRAGSADRNFGGIIRDVAIILNHPTFGENAFDGDINLLFLESELVYSNVIKQATIVTSGFTVPGNWPITHIGWGMVSDPGEYAPILLEVGVLSINLDVCRERYADMPTAVITDNMFCTGILDVSGKGPCYGDSGGPVFYDNIVIGIVSWGEGCGNKTTPAVNVAVSSYTDWIVENAV